MMCHSSVEVGPVIEAVLQVRGWLGAASSERAQAASSVTIAFLHGSALPDPTGKRSWNCQKFLFSYLEHLYGVP